MTEHKGVERSETELTPTERLRAMLDERGIEWRRPPHYSGNFEDNETIFKVNGSEWYAYDHGNGLFALRTSRLVVSPEQAIAATAGPQITEDTSDGWHSFKDLYHHRALLFSVIVNAHPEMSWKSKRHHDGTMYDGMFIVGIETSDGQATYHYDLDPYWDMFNCKELERAPEWDGHTPDDAIERIARLGSEEYTSTVGTREYTYGQWVAVSEAVADAMKYAHDVAIRHPDKADPYWDLDNYVSRVMDVAFGAGTVVNDE